MSEEVIYLISRYRYVYVLTLAYLIWRNFSLFCSPLFFQHSDNIVAVSSGARGFVPRSLQTGDIDSAGGSIVSDQDIPQQEQFLSPKSAKSNDNSLTYSEDSDTTRIYNLNTRETKIVAPVEDEKVDESPIESPVKLGQKFFARQTSGIRKMDDEVTTVIRTSNRNLINGDDGSVSFSVPLCNLKECRDNVTLFNRRATTSCRRLTKRSKSSSRK